MHNYYGGCKEEVWGADWQRIYCQVSQVHNSSAGVWTGGHATQGTPAHTVSMLQNTYVAEPVVSSMWVLFKCRNSSSYLLLPQNEASSDDTFIRQQTAAE